MKFQFFSEKIEFSKLNLKIEFHEPPNGSWKVLGCNTGVEYLGGRKNTRFGKTDKKINGQIPWD